MRVYKFGLRPPVEGERLVREQLRAAHEYRNDLVAIERGRRHALRAIDGASDAVREAEAVVRASTKSTRKKSIAALRVARKEARAEAADELARIKERDESIRRDARALTPCFWGTYLDVEAAHQQSRAQPLYGADAVSPNDPSFARGPRWRDVLAADDPRAAWWLAPGQVGIQLQGGLPTREALSGKDTRVRLVLHGDGSRGRRYGTLWLRVGSEGRAPVWAKWPIKMHRAIPDAAVWKWVRVSLSTEGTVERWSVEITVDDPTPRARDLARPAGTIAIEWEWSPLDDGGIRVARWADDRGETGEIALPASMVSGIRKPNGIRAVRDMLTNDMSPCLVRAVQAAGPSAPRWLVEAANTMHLWKSPQRFRALAMRWRREGLPDPRAAYEILDAWEERDDHLLSYESGARGEALRERREFYRVVAAQWARAYGVVLLSDQDLSREARWGDDSDVRFVAGVSELRLAIRNAFGAADAVDARWREEVDEDDERAWCERCIAAWQAGGARGDGRFAALKEKSANAWATRKSKSSASAVSPATARKSSDRAAE